MWIVRVYTDGEDPETAEVESENLGEAVIAGLLKLKQYKRESAEVEIYVVGTKSEPKPKPTAKPK